MRQSCAVGTIFILGLCAPAVAQNCESPLTCPVPSPGNSCISGQLFDLETSEFVRAANPTGDPCTQPTATGPCSVEVLAFDGLGFFQNPTGTPPLPSDVVVDDCGFYLVSEFPTPALGFVVITTDDAPLSDNLIIAAKGMGIAPGSRVDDNPMYAFRTTTDQAWTVSAGDPFGGQTFSETGVFVAIFLNGSYSAPGVAITRNGSVFPADDYYFEDENPSTRSTVNSLLDATGANGTALMVNSELVEHGGYGGEFPGCFWPSDLGKSVPGAAVVHEFHSTDSTTGDPCTEFLFVDGFESGDLTAWSAVGP